MTYFPEPEGFKLIPEGHYQFRIHKEPELKKFTYTKDGDEKESRKIVIEAMGANADGDFYIKDHIAVFEPRYKDLCEALGVEHGKDIAVSGAIFEADIKHEPDKRNPQKAYPRLQNIKAKGAAEDDDIPF